MSKYVDLLGKKTEEQQDSELRKQLAVKAENATDGAISSAKQAVAEAGIAVAQAKKANPFDPEAVIAAIAYQAELEQTLSTLKAVRTELFG